jgi:hypothetical protein
MSDSNSIAVNLQFVNSNSVKEINEFAFEIEKMLNSLITKLNVS